MPEKRVVVFARNSDPVCNNPEAVARCLREGVFPRPFRGKPIGALDEVGVVSFWTRNPSNLLDVPALRDALETCNAKSILLELQVSVTGFGGRFSFVELDVPEPEVVAERLREIIDCGLIRPELIRIRMDPILSMTVRDPSGDSWTVSNMRLDLVEHLLRLFAPLDIRRYVFSHRDAGNYDASKLRIRERLARIGIELNDDVHDDVVSFFRSVHDRCLSYGVEFALCANPPSTALPYGACIDNVYYMKQAPTLRLTRERSRNSQRPFCGCHRHALSADALGDTACYPKGRGCLFCYSQGRSLGNASLGFRRATELFVPNRAHDADAMPAPYRGMIRAGSQMRR